MEQRQTTTKGITILSIAGIINKLLALVYLPIQSHIVANYGNGIIGSGYNIYILIFSLSNAGLPVVISKLTSEQNAKGNFIGSQRVLKTCSIVMMSLGIFFGSFMALGAKWISVFINQPKASLMILALSPALLFTSVSSIFRGYFQGRLNMIPTAISQIIEQGLNSVFTIVFISLLIRYGISAAAAGSTIGTSLGAMGAAVFLFFVYIKNKKYRAIELKNSTYSGKQLSYKYILKQIRIYTAPAILGVVASNLNNMIDLKLCVSRLIAGGFSHIHAVELYGILNYQFQKILNVPLAITNTIPMALIPAISAALAVKNTEMMKRKLNEGLKAILLITVPSAAGLAFLARPIITFVFFSRNQGSDLMIMGSWVIILIAVNFFQNSILIGIGKPKIPPINMTIGMILKIILNYFLISIPWINVKGSIIGTILAYLAACILNYFSIKKYIEFKPNFKKIIFKPVFASVAMGFSVYGIYDIIYNLLINVLRQKILLNDISLLITIPFGVCIYLFVLLYSKALNENDILKLPLGEKLVIILKKTGVLRSL